MDNLTPEECKDYLKKIREISICQVCREQLRSPNVVACTNGHAVCISCKLRVPFCDLCNSPFCQAKPITLCQVIDVLPHSYCSHYPCQHRLQENDDHKSWCWFRLLTCFLCDQRIECGKLLTHLFDAHNYNPQDMLVADLRRSDFKCEELNINAVLLKLYDGHMFYIHYFYCENNRSLNIHVTFYPTKSVKNTFIITFEMRSHKKDKLSFSREFKLEPNIKTDAFHIPYSLLEILNGKKVLFRITILDGEVTNNSISS